MTADPEPVALRSQEAVTLAHGLAWAVAQQAGIRILFVKGLSVQELGLRRPRSIADVDILVDPLRIADYVDRLAVLGWHERPHLTLPAKAAPNAITMVHDNWSCDLDLHVWMRGLYGVPTVVFERLWRDHITVTIGGVTVPTPNRPASALVAAVNCLRDPFLDRKRHELKGIIDVAVSEFSMDEIELTDELARTLRCVTTGRPYLERVLTGRRDLNDDLTPAERAEWARLTVQENSTLSWWDSLRREKLFRKFAVTARFLWPDDYTLRRTRPHTRPGQWGGFVGRFARIGTGLAKVPSALRVWRTRKAELAEQRSGRR